MPHSSPQSVKGRHTRCRWWRGCRRPARQARGRAGADAPFDAEAQQPVLAVVLPVAEPLEVGAGLAEELALHLLELAGAEGEVARGDLVAEGLAHLADAEGQLAAGGALDVGKVDEDALRGLGAEVAGGRAVLGDADGGLEHQVELTDGGEVVLAADGADHVLVLGDESVHLVKAHGVHVHLGVLVADELVGAVAGLAGAAVQQGVEKPATWPVVTQVWGFMRMAASRPTL